MHDSVEESEVSSKVFTVPNWQRGSLFVIALMVGTAALWSFRSIGLSIESVGLSVFSLIALCGFVDSIISKVELRGDSLVVVDNLRRREYPRDEFKRAVWEKGAPVALERNDGDWLKLPNFVGGGPGVVSIFRAWLKH